MFDFEKLEVYQLAKGQNANVYQFLNKQDKIEPEILTKWKNASLNIVLNLAEGTGRMIPAEKKNYYILCRSSVFECVALLEFCVSMNWVDKEKFDELYDIYEQLSKMMLAMYRNVQ